MTADQNREKLLKINPEAPLANKASKQPIWGRLPVESPFRELSFLPPSLCVFSPYIKMPFDDTVPREDPKKPRT